MRPFLLAALLSVFLPAIAQDRSAELGAAAEEARAAALALKEAEERREKGIEAQPGERLGTAGGGTRASDEYQTRQGQLEKDVETARRRYDEAQKRWNDLK